MKGKKQRFDKVTLDGFKETLDRKRQELAAELSKHGVVVPLERCPDDMDAVNADMERALNTGLANRAITELGLVCDALKKICVAPAKYGACENEDCETGEILLKRLMAVPWAKYCILCQEAADAEAHMRTREASGHLDEIGL